MESEDTKREMWLDRTESGRLEGPVEEYPRNFDYGNKPRRKARWLR